MTSDILSDIRSYAKRIIGPVAFSYAKWIIHEAKKRNITRLYFLARDGYLLYKIAKRICSVGISNIECRYLYCSRASLRAPTFHLIGDEAYELLTLGGYYITPRTILSRASLSDEEIDEICDALGVNDKDGSLSDKDLSSFRVKLAECELYKNAVIKRSIPTYEPTVSYLRQEKLFECDRVAIVDSGWTGSMQRSLRQLLESAGYKGELIGFYFGMYNRQKESCDGEYLTYYFDAQGSIKRKIFFNNNLFECMLSADHPMTVGYEHSHGAVFPKFDKRMDESLKELACHQICGAMDFVNEKLSEEYSFKPKSEIKRCYKILKRAMVYPTRRFATVYGTFTFCDDVTEGYAFSLAKKDLRKQLSSYMLIPRIFRKLFKLKKPECAELLWPYGVIAFAPLLLRPWYRLNLIGWELLKALRSHRKNAKESWRKELQC